LGCAAGIFWFNDANQELNMKGFVTGVVLTLFVVVGGVYAYFAWGMAPVATASSPMMFERKLAHMALNSALKKEMPKTVPIEASEANYLTGAHEYLIHCAVCHGAPGREKTAIARGEFPSPPVLLEGKGVTDDPPGETYWKIANGIRLSGMPGFSQSLSETQMWQMSLLLANADKLPATVRAMLAAPPAPPEPTAAPPTSPK
jgi:mono/diheme cytochrome c family protein